jgi:hypothetical protein
LTSSAPLGPPRLARLLAAELHRARGGWAHGGRRTTQQTRGVAGHRGREHRPTSSSTSACSGPCESPASDRRTCSAGMRADQTDA